MATILILGAGVMGTALAVPAADNGHDVLLAGTPLDADAIGQIKAPGGAHPKLDEPLPKSVIPLLEGELTQAHASGADLIILGVSSPGIAWAVERLNALLSGPTPVAFVTKGLDRQNGRVVSFAETVPPQVRHVAPFIGIGGPCIARELANRTPTLSIYASRDRKAAAAAASLLRTPYYRLDVSEDATGVEACAALKNFFAIGVSAMQTRHPDRLRTNGQFKNPTAGAFNQAAREMALLCECIGGQRDTAFDLAGLGDLHVTVGGGRNSRLGHGLGEGMTVAQVLAGPLAGETVEGVDTARVVADLVQTVPDAERTLPLASAIIAAVLDDSQFAFDLGGLYG